MKKILLAFSALTVASQFSQAQIFWGAGSGNPTSDSIGTFAAPLDSVGGWDVVPGANNAFFVKSTTGGSPGAYFGTLTPFNSASLANGAVLFDSDYMDNNGIAGNFGQGVSAAPHGAMLYSPIFSLTNLPDTNVAIEFDLYYREFDITTMNVGISTDSGVTWNNYSFNQNVGVNTVFPQAIVSVPISGAIANATSLSNCQLRFELFMDYYFVYFDDVRIVGNCPTLDTVVTVNNETLTAQATGVTYQWVTCPSYAPAPGNSTDSTYTATSNGDYAVIITAGTCVDTSACITILSTGLNGQDGALNMYVYPNPSNGDFKVVANKDVMCDILTLTGQVIDSFSINSESNNTKTISGLAAGTYFVRTFDGNNTVIQKVQVVR